MRATRFQHFRNQTRFRVSGRISIQVGASGGRMTAQACGLSSCVHFTLPGLACDQVQHRRAQRRRQPHSFQLHSLPAQR